MKTNKIVMPQTQSLNKETVCFKVPAKNLEGKQFVVVPEGWEAVCISDGQLGKVLKRGKYKLSTLKNKSHLFEVLFYPTLSEFSFLWGTKEQMDFSDPVLSLPVKMGANGKLVFLIRNIRNLYLTSKQGESLEIGEIKNQIVPSLVKFLQEKIAENIKEEKISFLDFEKNKDKMFKSIMPELTFFLQNEFGVKLSIFLVDGIIFDKKLFKALEKEILKSKVMEKEQEEQVKKTMIVKSNIMLESQINQKNQTPDAVENIEIESASINQKEKPYQEAETQVASTNHQEEMMLL